MNYKKLVFAGCWVAAGCIGFGAFIWPNLNSRPAPPASPLSLTGPRSFNLPNNAIVSCDANGPGQAVSFISQSNQSGRKKTVIISEDDDRKTVAVIDVYADRILWGHWPDPIEHASPMLAKGTYDAGKNIYKIKYLGPGDVVPTLKDWQENLALAKTICGGRAPDGMSVTLRAEGIGAYEANRLDIIDEKLKQLLPWKNPTNRHEIDKNLALDRYKMSVFLPD